jgi:hypothetical protein
MQELINAALFDVFVTWLMEFRIFSSLFVVCSLFIEAESNSGSVAWQVRLICEQRT